MDANPIEPDRKESNLMEANRTETNPMEASRIETHGPGGPMGPVDCSMELHVSSLLGELPKGLHFEAPRVPKFRNAIDKSEIS